MNLYLQALITYIKNFPMNWKQLIIAITFIYFTLSLVVDPIDNYQRDNCLDWQDIEDIGEADIDDSVLFNIECNENSVSTETY